MATAPGITLTCHSPRPDLHLSAALSTHTLMLEKRPEQESNMTRASRITLLATVVLSSFTAAAQDGGRVWWPQFRGPNSSGLGGGRPPVHFGPDQNVRWKTAVGPG